MREIDGYELNEYFESNDRKLKAKACERLVVFAKETMFERLKKVHTLPTDILNSLKCEIENLFQCISEMTLGDFCLKLWSTLVELSDGLIEELANSIDLSIALRELIHVAKYMTKGEDTREMIQ